MFSKLLRESETQQVHDASLEILDRVGIEVNHPRAREIYRRHGARVDDRTLRVTLAPRVVEEFLASLPHKFTFCAQDPAYDRTIPDDAPLTITASSAPNIIDPVSGELRRATSDDIARAARLVDQLPGVDLFSVSMLADDAPAGQYSLTRFYTALKYCRKPIRGSGDPGIDCESILALGAAIAGSEQAYRDHPFITHHYCPVISPLKMDQNSTELMLFYTEQGLPSYPTIVPNGGLTAPLTLAGTLAQGNAEFLALAVLREMVQRGTPTVYNVLPTIADMRSGAYAPGGIECGMLNMAHAQMARFYNLPCGGYIGLTNSKVVDAQAGYEKALSAMGGMLAGMDVLQFVGLIDALMTFDFGMAVIDSEIALMLKRVARGMEVSSSTLAVDEIVQIGPGGTFITSERTLERMHTTALMPNIADRDARATWTDHGAEDAHSRALRRAREILSETSEALFSPAVETRIRQRFAGLVRGDLTLPEGW